MQLQLKAFQREIKQKHKFGALVIITINGMVSCLGEATDTLVKKQLNKVKQKTTIKSLKTLCPMGVV